MSTPLKERARKPGGKPEAKPGAAPKKPRKPRQSGSRGLEGSPEAKRLASLVLEVLGGLRTVSDACEEAGMSLQRYYRLETSAIQAVVASLEPRPKGPPRKPENEIARLSKERDRLERELRRAQSLVRVAQRTVGLSSSPSPAAPRKGKASGRKRKRPRVRMRAVVEELSAPATNSPAQGSAPSAAQPGK